MPTKNPQLQIVLEKPLYKALSSLAQEGGVSMSLMARDLIKYALTRTEDVALAGIVAERVKKPAKLIRLREFETRRRN